MPSVLSGRGEGRRSGAGAVPEENSAIKRMVSPVRAVRQARAGEVGATYVLPFIRSGPRVMGEGLSMARFTDGAVLDDLTAAAQWRWLDAVVVGDDMRLRARKI